MIVNTPASFLAALEHLPPLPDARVTAQAAFLVAPASAELAAESASDNRYMQMQAQFDAVRALAQHAALATALRADCPVISFPGDATMPDAMFPNNVFATAPGRYIVGRMRHPMRQREAERSDIRAFFRDTLGRSETDLSRRNDCVAELTGSLVIDHQRGIGYCGLSERCDPAGAHAMHEAFGLRLTFCFELQDSEYHTNVVMASLAGRAAILAADGFRDPAVPHAIARAYRERVLWLSPEQKRAYAGNAITLSPDRVWMSAGGAASLKSTQRQTLADWGFAIGEARLDEIEKAGGSLRCCVGEIF
ncbi:MAG: amidinotransferase [Proteobacteria bacterium]|uniref:arginine deiminase-related protein n=1 Tax=Rudaea sp. TaxID=2136325 RepID=UPI001D2C38A1|nr:amidinotransferase [Pseudomonadota bacterium]MBS0568207.1 amidinotransferase [Pseudomonadota bacterium]